MLSHYYFNTLGPILLIWYNFNSSMDKNDYGYAIELRESNFSHPSMGTLIHGGIKVSPC